MSIGTRRKKWLTSIVSHLTLIILSVLFMIPFVWLLLTSVKSEAHMMKFPPEWLPRADYVLREDGKWWEIIHTQDLSNEGHPDQLRVKVCDPWGQQETLLVIDKNQKITRNVPILRHYFQGLTAFNFALFLQNTLWICTVAVCATMLSSSLVAYSFSILRWPGRDVVFYLMLATMMLPGQVTMIPVFLIHRYFGWVNTYVPLLIGSFYGNAFFIFLLRQFFLTIPHELIEAAKADGCSDWRIYWQIVLPLSTSALAVVALFTFLGHWNDFLGPLIYLVDERKYTLSLGLAMFRGEYGTRYGEMMAVSALLTLPIIILFFFTQKTFIQGIKTSGMKG